MSSISYLSTFVLALTALQTAAALPAAVQVYPEVTPGPGLPSLASLNLTSAELYTKPLPSTLAVRAAEFDLTCGPDAGYVDVNDIIACYHYLAALGTTACGVPADNVVINFCNAGSGAITGQGLESPAQSSYCSDVAIGALDVINGCTRPDQTVAGVDAANGNGNLLVGCFASDFA